MIINEKAYMDMRNSKATSRLEISNNIRISWYRICAVLYKKGKLQKTKCS
jgi:hypothetical protein